jgi:hypothetical protein
MAKADHSDQNRVIDMSDFSSITSLKAAEFASQEGSLLKVLLVPAELGGQDQPENVVYIPAQAWEIKRKSTDELLSAVRSGINDIEIVPEYRGTSFVPTKITITAASSGTVPGYKLEIEIW